MARFLSRLTANEIGDVEQGDFVRRVGYRGVGFVQSADCGYATVTWARDRRDILPFCALRRVSPGGSDWDRR
jgi:hypothetical protein